MPTLPKVPPPSSLRPDKFPAVSHSIEMEARPYLVSALRRREAYTDGMRIVLAERSVTLFAHESEDAKLTGSTRSLYRRLLALNLPTSSAIDVTAAKPSASAKKFPSRVASA